jgi:hypothetical protein
LRARDRASYYSLQSARARHAGGFGFRAHGRRSIHTSCHEQTFSASNGERLEEQVKLVDEVVREQ